MASKYLDEASTLLIGMRLCDFHDHIMDLLARRGARVGPLADSLKANAFGLQFLNDIRISSDLPFPVRIITLLHEAGHYIRSVRENRDRHKFDEEVGYGLSSDGAHYIYCHNEEESLQFDDDIRLPQTINRVVEDRADKYAYRAIRLLRHKFLYEFAKSNGEDETSV